MTWKSTLCFILVLSCVSCTIRVEPLKTTPAKKPVYKHRYKVKRIYHVSPTPTPYPLNTPKRPLDLEPTEHPTPMIHLSQAEYIKRIPPMEMYL